MSMHSLRNMNQWWDNPSVDDPNEGSDCGCGIIVRMQGLTHILVIRNYWQGHKYDRPKIHSDNSVKDHAIYLPEARFRITLSLIGVFSGFHVDAQCHHVTRVW